MLSRYHPGSRDFAGASARYDLLSGKKPDSSMIPALGITGDDPGVLTLIPSYRVSVLDFAG
jgi:hypothetical protein